MEKQPPNNNDAQGQDEQLSTVDEGGPTGLIQSDQVADFVRERPLVALGVATAAGFIIGRVIGR